MLFARILDYGRLCRNTIIIRIGRALKSFQISAARVHQSSREVLRAEPTKKNGVVLKIVRRVSGRRLRFRSFGGRIRPAYAYRAWCFRTLLHVWVQHSRHAEKIHFHLGAPQKRLRDRSCNTIHGAAHIVRSIFTPSHKCFHQFNRCFMSRFSPSHDALIAARASSLSSYIC